MLQSLHQSKWPWLIPLAVLVCLGFAAPSTMVQSSRESVSGFRLEGAAMLAPHISALAESAKDCKTCEHGGTVRGTGGDGQHYEKSWSGPGTICPVAYKCHGPASTCEGKDFFHNKLNGEWWPSAGWGVSQSTWVVTCLNAEPVLPSVIGQIVGYEGKVWINRRGTLIEITQRYTAVVSDDVLVVGPNSRARVEFIDINARTNSGPSTINLGPDTEFVVQEFFVRFDGPPVRRGVFELMRGMIRAVTSNWGGDNAFSVKSGATLMGIRGTDFALSYDPIIDSTRLLLNDGAVTLTNETSGVTRHLFAGQEIRVTNNQFSPPIPITAERWEKIASGLAVTNDDRTGGRSNQTVNRSRDTTKTATGTADCKTCENGGTVSGIGGDGKRYEASWTGFGMICPVPYTCHGPPNTCEGVPFFHNQLNGNWWPNAGWGVSENTWTVTCSTKGSRVKKSLLRTINLRRRSQFQCSRLQLALAEARHFRPLFSTSSPLTSQHFATPAHPGAARRVVASPDR